MTSGRFQHHFRRYCTKNNFLKEKEPAPATSAKKSRITYGSHSNPTVPRNPLMASDTLTSSTVSKNSFESEGSPPDPPEEAPAPALSEQTPGNEALHPSPRRPGIDTQHDAANLRDKKRKAQCTSHGSMPFQIQLMDILQKHECPMKMHDKIIDLVNNGLWSDNWVFKGRQTTPPLPQKN